MSTLIWQQNATTQTRKRMNSDRNLLNELSGGCNIFFAFTPFNLLVVDALLELEHIASRPCLVINTSKRDYQHSSAHVINFRRDKSSRALSLLGYWCMSRLISKLRKTQSIQCVFSPHPHNMLSNGLMFDEGGHGVCIYEDGIGNYWNSENVDFLKRQSVQKRRVAPLLGFSYRDYDGHFTGISERIFDTGYFVSPEKIYQANRFASVEKIHLSVFQEIDEQPCEPIVLLLDQHIEVVYDVETTARLRKRLSDVVMDIGLPIHVKAHPAQDGPDPGLELGPNVTFVPNQSPAEYAALELRPMYVVSFTSSALKNIKALLPKSTCISVGIDEFDKLRGCDLGKVFEGFDLLVV